MIVKFTNYDDDLAKLCQGHLKSHVTLVRLFSRMHLGHVQAFEEDTIWGITFLLNLKGEKSSLMKIEEQGGEGRVSQRPK